MRRWQAAVVSERLPAGAAVSAADLPLLAASWRKDSDMVGVGSAWFCEVCWAPVGTHDGERVDRGFRPEPLCVGSIRIELGLVGGQRGVDASLPARCRDGPCCSIEKPNSLVPISLLFMT